MEGYESNRVSWDALIMIPAWVEENNYTDIPFLNLGRDTVGWDCYGLVKYISEKHYKKILPDVQSYINANDANDTIKTIRVQVLAWEEVEVPQPGDVVLFRPAHCGLVLGDRWMLHVMTNCITALEDYTRFPWNQRHDGFYTYTYKN